MDLYCGWETRIPTGACMRKRRIQQISVAIVLLYLMGSLFFAQVRPLDGDEGYYASAIRLVSEGKTPYQDFFYPQSPLLPYIYSPAYLIAGSSIIGLRFESAILGTLGLIFWGLFLALRYRWQMKPLLAGLILLAVNPHLLSWNLTVKSFALANLALLIFFWAWQRSQVENQWRDHLVMGLSLGILVSTRMLYAPWVGFVLVFLLVPVPAFRPSNLGSLGPSRTGALVAGLLVGLLPTLILALKDFDSFVFNNFTYHSLKSMPLDLGIGPVSRIVRLDALSEVLKNSFFQNPVLVLLLALSLWGVLALIHQRKEQSTAFLILAAGGFLVHLGASLIPFPTHVQYFTAPMVPLLLPLAMAGLLSLDRMIPGPVIWFVLLLGTTLAANDLLIRRVGMNQDPQWSLENLAKVTREIEARTQPEDEVFAFWSGYTFESGRRYSPGMENHFAIGISERLTLAEKEKYKVAGKESLLKMFQQARPEMIISGTWMNSMATGLHQDQMRGILQPIKTNYDIVAVVGEVKLAQRKMNR